MFFSSRTKNPRQSTLSKRHKFGLRPFEALESRLLLDSQWHNVLAPPDVNNSDGIVSPIDALLVINELNSPVHTDPVTGEFNPLAGDAAPAAFRDVDCDGHISPVDAIRVMNVLNGDATYIGWQQQEHGGSDDPGGAYNSGCNVGLREGDSFLSELRTSFVVSETQPTVEIDFAELSFDQTDPSFINDSFELALVGADGLPLVDAYLPSRDAFFNVTEGLDAKFSADVEVKDATFQGEDLIAATVMVDLSAVPDGTTATLVARLVNDDDDTTTNIQILDVGLSESTFISSSPVSRHSAIASADPIIWPDSTERMAATSRLDTLVHSSEIAFKSAIDEVSAFHPELEWHTNSFEIRPDSIQVMMTPAVADVNQDSIPDVIFSTFVGKLYQRDGVLRAVSGADGSHLWTLDDPRYEVAGASSIAVGDIDDDGLVEIIAGHETDVLMAVEHDGTFKWLSESVGGVSWGGASLVDLDGNGTVEIVIGSTVLDSDGAKLWTGSGGRGSNSLGPLSVVADLDLDGTPEIVAGRTAYRADGDVMWNADIKDGFPAVGNFDDDTYPEIVVVGQGRVYLLDHQGEVIWNSPLPGGGKGGAPTIADFDGDGKAEVGVAGGRRYVVFDTDGSVKWESPIRDSTSNLTGSSVFDFNGDGTAEVIYGDETTLRIYNGFDGDVLYTMEKSSCTTYEYPVVVDVDADGSTEIVAVANQTCGFGPENGVYVLGDPSWEPTRQIWNQHTYHITNVNDDGTIPRDELPSWLIYNNYRRNSQTTGTELPPPSITATITQTRTVIGSNVLISGVAKANGSTSGRANTIVAAWVNGMPLDRIDQSGNFFHLVEAKPGRQNFEIVVQDEVGQTATTELQLEGVSDQLLVDFDRYADVSSSFSGVYGRTSFDDESNILFVDLATRNDGQFSSDVPLLVGVTNISDASVELLNLDGISPNGIPYYDFTRFVPAGKLDPGETTNSPNIAFDVPNRSRFDYELVFYGKLNEAPIITTIPTVDALAGKPYEYDVDATDSDDDEIIYRLQTAPAETVIDASIGVMSWSPQSEDIGNHEITVIADDQRGGIASQTYSLSVIEPPPNRPPIITSQPITTAVYSVPPNVEVDPGNLVINGSFEEQAGKFTGSVGGNQITGWQVLSGNVHKWDGTWSSIGANPNEIGPEFSSIDLDGSTPGSIAQMIPTKPDQLYELSFLMGANHFARSGPREMEVFWSGESLGRFTHELAEDETPARFEWDEHKITVTGSGSDELRFVSTDGPAPGWGAAVDLIQLTAIGASPTYVYDVVAFDPDLDALTYDLVATERNGNLSQPPSGMKISPSTGRITWAPTSDQIGEHDVSVKVSDGRGGIAEQTFVVAVKGDPENHPPVIVSAPVTEFVATPQSNPSIGPVSPALISVTGVPGDVTLHTVEFTPETLAVTPSADIVFLVDQSSSMKDQHEWLYQPAEDGIPMIDSLDQALAEAGIVNRRYALIGYGKTDVQPFTLGGNAFGTHEEFRNAADPSIGDQGLSRRFGNREDGYIAMHYATDNLEFAAGASIHFVLVTDEDRNQAFSTLERGQVLDKLTSLDITLNAIVNATISDGALGIDSRMQTIVADGGGGFQEGPVGEVTRASGDTVREYSELAWQLGGLSWDVETIAADPNAAKSFTNAFLTAQAEQIRNDFIFDVVARDSEIQFENLSGPQQLSDESNIAFDISLTVPGNPTLLDFEIVNIVSGDTVASVPVRINSSYLYDAHALDADADQLTWSLLNGPESMQIDVSTGQLTWDGKGTVDGMPLVSIGVNDGRGGFDAQEFKVSLSEDGESVIRGSKAIGGDSVLTTLTEAVENWVIYLDQNENTIRDSGERFTLTDENGNYEFTNLPAGTYFVREEPRAGWQQLLPGDPAGSSLISNGSFEQFAIAPESWHPQPHLGHHGLGTSNTELDSWEIVDGTIDFIGGPPRFIGRSLWSWNAADGTRSLDLAGTSPGTIRQTVDTEVGKAYEIRFKLAANSDDNRLATTEPSRKTVRVTAGEIEQEFEFDFASEEATYFDMKWKEFAFPFIAASTTTAIVFENTTGPGVAGPALDSVSVRELVPGGHIVQLEDGEIVTQVDFTNRQLPYTKNTPPTFDTHPNILATEFATVFRYDSRAIDFENDTLTYELSLAPSGMTINPRTGTIVWVPKAEQEGLHNVVVRVHDGMGGSDVQAFDISAVPPNSPPIITSTFPGFAVVGESFEFKFSAQDAEGDSFQLQLTTFIRDMSLDDSVFRWTPESEIANQVFTILAEDEHGAEREFAFTVSAVDDLPNSAPVIHSNPRTSLRPGALYSYSIEASDADGNPLNYEFAGGYTPPVGMRFDMAQPNVLIWQPESDFEPEDVRLQVRDSRGAITTHEPFSIQTVPNAVNSAPMIVSTPPPTAHTERVFAYELVADDPDGDPIAWDLVEAPFGMSINAISGAIRWIPTLEQAGVTEVTVRATDSLLSSSTQTFSIEVSCVNNMPNIDSVPNTLAQTGVPYFYAVRAIDPDGDELEYELANNPLGMSIGENGLITWIPNEDDIADSPHQVTVVAREREERGSQRGFAIQEFEIVVEAIEDSAIANRPPRITSSPAFVAEVDETYNYQVVATDPEDAELTYELLRKPSDAMSISPNGLVTWTPADGDKNEGGHTIVVKVTDASGGIATQGYSMSVINNEPPTISSTPVDTANAGATYRYSVNVEDPDNDPRDISFEVVRGPNGMSVDKFGRVIWQVPDAAEDPVSVEIVAHDLRETSAPQVFTIDLVPDVTPPSVSVTANVDGRTHRDTMTADAGSDILLEVVATDNVAVQAVSLQVNGTTTPLNDLGQATISLDKIGTFEVVATALDRAGNEGQKKLIIESITPGASNRPVPTTPGLPPIGNFDDTDQNHPTVVIHSPITNEAITERVPINVTVDDPEDRLWYYSLYVARADRVDLRLLNLSDPGFTRLQVTADGANENGYGTQEVIEQDVAFFDPANLSNDPYVIALAGYDHNGRGYVTANIVTVEGNVQFGNFTLSFTDLSIPLSGIPIEVTRVYNTLNAPDVSDFGHGWSLGVQDARIFETAPEDYAFVPDNPATNANEGTRVYLTNPSGQRVAFTFQQDCSGGFLGSVCTPRFVPDPGVYDTLTVFETISGGGGAFGTIASELAGPFNPSRYKLTTKDGLTYEYNQDDGLRLVTDENGNQLTFTHNGIAHSSGANVEFVRDPQGRIEELRVFDGDGNLIIDGIMYKYDANGDLRMVTDASHVETLYRYRSNPKHFLQSSHTAGKLDFTVVYDEATGQLLEIKDANGNPIQTQDYDSLAENIGVVRDANGNETQLKFNKRGNVTHETDALGNTTIREYTDPRNPDLETTIIDRRGFVTERRYSDDGDVMQIVEMGHKDDPFEEPIVTSFTYNVGNNVTSITNALKQPTTFRYNGDNLTEIRNAEGNSSFFSYYANGDRETFTDFNGNVTTFSDYKNGQPQTITFADGTQQTFTYNGYGQVTYEAYAEADGTVVEERRSRYDRAGRIVEESTGSESDGSLTVRRMIYVGDLLEWEIVVHPDEAHLIQEGTESPDRSVWTLDKLSRITDYEYDANDNLIRQIQFNVQEDENGTLVPHDSIVDFRYDANGNRIALRDPVGNITTWLYDELNRAVEERDPFYWEDARNSDAAFADLSDDEFLDLIAPLVPLNPFDETDTRDPLYDDPSGADCETNIPSDHVRLTCYDGEGNQSKTIDRNARRREFIYDHAGRLLEELWFSKEGELVETITFGYDPLGNMLTATNSNSNYLFTYNTLNQLDSVDNNPDGTLDLPRVILTYGYDPQGNVTLTQDNFGVTVESQYNARNQLEWRKWYDAVVNDGEAPDVDDARVDFLYNAAGREANINRYSDLDANTLVGSTGRTYDLSGRSDILRHDDAEGDLLAGYDYGYNFSGLLTTENRTHQNPEVAQVIGYRHDLTGQLTQAHFGVQEDEHYVFDANGNRVTSEVGGDQRTYTIGPANQLESDGLYRYEYDGEGNQIKRVPILPDGSDDPSGTVRTFVYDHLNRMLHADDWNSDPGDPLDPEGGSVLIRSAQYAYDSLARRISRFSVSEDQSSERVWFLYNGENVWNDVTSTGGAVYYLFGNRIDHNIASFSTFRNINWYLTDRIGSSRDIVNENGHIAGHAEYSAFGTPIANTGFTDRYGLAGREFDKTLSTYFNRARLFDPINGRFISEDPLRFLAEDVNLARYVNNSPVNGVDPSGMLGIVGYSLVGAGIVGAFTFGSSLFVNFTCKESDALDDKVIRSVTYTFKGALIGAAAGLAFFGAGVALNGLAGVGVSGQTGFVTGNAVTRTAAIATIKKSGAIKATATISSFGALYTLLESDIEDCIRHHVP